MPVLLPKGTKEFLLAVVTDNLGNVTTLDDVDVTYTIEGPTGTKIVNEASADTDGMTVLCLIDTAAWAEGEYRLFVSLDIEPQKPIFGPFKFTVEDYYNDVSPIVT